MAAPTTSIFRREALEYRARQQGRRLAADVVFPRLMARRAWLALWALLAAFAIGAALACLPTVPVRASGLAVAPADGQGRIAILAVGGEPAIRSGNDATISLGGRSVPGTVTTVESMTPAEAMRQLALPWPAARILSGQVTVAWVVPDDRATVPPGAIGNAKVDTGSRQAGSYLPVVGRFFRSEA